jgi:hypothetical protein
MLLTSKGAAGVTGSGFVALVATLTVMPDLPVTGVALLIGIDRFMSEARALTSMISNCVASIVVSLWENACDREVPGPRAWTERRRHHCRRRVENRCGGGAEPQRLDVDDPVSRLMKRRRPQDASLHQAAAGPGNQPNILSKFDPFRVRNPSPPRLQSDAAQWQGMVTPRGTR